MASPFRPAVVPAPARGSLCHGSSIAPDCPARRAGVLESLVRGEGAACALFCAQVGAREPLPADWFATHGVALVRRGLLVRQRSAGGGPPTAVDVAGPGAVFPLPNSGATGYAVTDALVCVCAPGLAEEAYLAGGSTALDLARLHAEALERMERIADARGRPTADGRVAAVLPVLAETLVPGGSRDRVPAGLLQRDLGALLGLRHESVCRALRRFENERLIVRDDGETRILSRERLAAVC